MKKFNFLLKKFFSAFFFCSISKKIEKIKNYSENENSNFERFFIYYVKQLVLFFYIFLFLISLTSSEWAITPKKKIKKKTENENENENSSSILEKKTQILRIKSIFFLRVRELEDEKSYEIQLKYLRLTELLLEPFLMRKISLIFVRFYSNFWLNYWCPWDSNCDLFDMENIHLFIDEFELYFIILYEG